MKPVRTFLRRYPPSLEQGLRAVAGSAAAPIYLGGGAVRDWLLDKAVRDIDVTVSGDPIGAARVFREIAGGTLVVLDSEHGVVRVAGRDPEVDFCRLRAADLAGDLLARDFTVNAMAVRLGPDAATDSPLLDPLGGKEDLAARCIRHCAPTTFRDDPLRVVRAFRFAATLGGTIAPETMAAMAEGVAGLQRVAGERLAMELDLLLAAGGAPWLDAMAEVGIFQEILPELAAGRGCVQPPSHHLDVFGHSRAALAVMDQLLADVATPFAAAGEKAVARLAAFAGDPANQMVLRWAALLHDIGKPPCRCEGERITFHGHDQAGQDLLAAIGARLRWSRDRQRRLARLISCHMWPFHLANVLRRQPLSGRACLRLARRLAEDLDGLFLLAYADSLAGQGPGKPADCEPLLVALYGQVVTLYHQQVARALTGPPLVTGHDLIQRFHLQPGPLFKKILDGVRGAQAAGEVTDRPSALAWVATWLARHHGTGIPTPPGER